MTMSQRHVVECRTGDDRQVTLVDDGNLLEYARLRQRIAELESQVERLSEENRDLKAIGAVPALQPLRRRPDEPWDAGHDARSIVSAKELRAVFTADGEGIIPESWVLECSLLLDVELEDAEALLNRLQRNQTSYAEERAFANLLQELVDRYDLPVSVPPDAVTRIKRFLQRCTS